MSKHDEVDREVARNRKQATQDARDLGRQGKKLIAGLNPPHPDVIEAHSKGIKEREIKNHKTIESLRHLGAGKEYGEK